MKCPYCGHQSEKRESCCFANWEDAVDDQFNTYALPIIFVAIVAMCIGMVCFLGAR